MRSIKEYSFIPPLKLLDTIEEDPLMLLSSSHGKGDSYMALGMIEELWLNDTGGAFDELQELKTKKKDWLFGYFGYDLKNELEDLSSHNNDGVGMPSLYFFQPEIVVEFIQDKVKAHYYPEITSEERLDELLNGNERNGNRAEKAFTEKVELAPRMSKAEYLEAISRLKDHIQHGDIYEVNFCQEFFAEEVELDPKKTFMDISEKTEAPMSAYLEYGKGAIMCGSPERYMRIQKNKVLSQPIKGTAPRDEDPKRDRRNAENLELDPKERAENIMIVDLVRNDLSRTALKGSVEVEELCEVYSFKTVHQLISSVVSRIGSDTDPLDVVRTSFPMGSMTGAPKIRAMELIEAYEKTKRGVYSGAMGYIKPNGDMDLNVVIRSLLYNKTERYLSCMVGGAITNRSVPEKEYDECLVKAEALRKVLAGNVDRSFDMNS